MKKIFLILLCLITATVVAAPPGHYGPYDPGAVRTNLSNVDAAATPSMASITLSDKVRAAWADILGDIYASGTVKVSTGTAAAPAYSFASDPNTGIYSPAADTLGLGAGGVSGLVTSGGNTAMGAAVAATTRLRIAGNTTTHSNTALVEPPSRSMSVGSANYIDALKIGLQSDSIPVGETDIGYRQGIYINNPMYSTNFKGTLANLYGLRVDTGILSGTGTLTNCYGVYIKTASGTGIITNNWGLYQETAAARNYFAGRTLIGTTTDDGVSALQVAGGGLRLVGGAAPSSPAEGSMYFNSTDKHFYGYNGTAWVQLDN